ncbi:hypothetical protein T5B8_01100 [Salinisphaera sp. T5B8]|uniref:NlpC/P60 family protein n=1 Tax=unclassified Salinisphaera TaxID=2649847 RepID=UPI003342A645
MAQAIMSQQRGRVYPQWLLMLIVAVLIGGCASQPSYRGSAGYSGIDKSRYPDHGAMVDALYDYYHQWRGVPYRYGGIDRNGIDCSAFVARTMSELESLNLPRTTSAQARLGQPISAGDLSPGDLVFFKTGYSSRHVGIYVGAGRFMHASTSQGVTMSRLDNIYWRSHYWQSRRLTTQTY